MKNSKINLHIHSNFSDGKSTIKQIVKKSIEYKLDYIAITDHFTNSWKSGIIPTLNSEEKINRYLKEISQCQNYLARNNEKLRLFKGIEIDITSSAKYIIRYIKPYEFDLVLFEYLEDPEGIAFIRNLVDNWKKNLSSHDIPIFGLGHFDPSHFIYGALDILMKFMKEFEIYFEFNSSYSEYYSRKNEIFFSKIKENNIMVGIGCDSHNLSNLVDIEEPIEMIRFYNLEDNYKSLINVLESKKSSG